MLQQVILQHRRHEKPPAAQMALVSEAVVVAVCDLRVNAEHAL